MDAICIKDLKKDLKREMDDSRYEHTLGVMYTSAALAMRYEYDMERAMLAGLMHDCAKCIPNAKKLKLAEKNGLEITELERNNPFMLHAKVGAMLAKVKYDIDDEEVKFKCDLLVSFKIEDKIQSYFIKYIDKDYDIRRYMELIKKFDTFVKDEELVDRYCIISDKKPKLVFIADTQELMQDLFNTIINYNIDFNNICLSCLDVIFKDKESKRFKEEDIFLDIAAYV